MKRLFVSLFVLLVLSSCTSRTIKEKFNWVEANVNMLPDSALLVMNTIDTTKVHGPRMKARYSLLRIMAMDKCYLDITIPGLLASAETWYSHHGTPDERLKMHFYRGRILHDLGRIPEGAVALSEGEFWADKAKDAHAIALLYLSFASKYNSVYNTSKEKEYKEKALRVLEEAGDKALYDRAVGELAFVYMSLKDWDKVDSLFTLGLRGAKDTPVIMRNYLSAFARAKLLRSDKDPEGAIALLDRKEKEYGSPLTPVEQAEYAYSLLLLGDTLATDRIIANIKASHKIDSGQVYVWLASIAQREGDYEDAYHYLYKSYDQEMNTVRDVIDDSVTTALKDHFQKKETEHSHHVHLLILYGSIAAALLIIAFLCVLLLNFRKEKQLNRLLTLQEVLQKELDANAHEYSASIQSMGKDLERVRGELDQTRRDYLKRCASELNVIATVGYPLWKAKLHDMNMEAAFLNVDQAFKSIRNIEKSGMDFEKDLDKVMNGGFTRAKEALGIRSRVKTKCLSMFLIGMGYKEISAITGISVENLYTMRSRMISRAKRLQSPLKEDIMSLLVREDS